MPIISQMIASGNGPAKASTKSAAPSGCSSSIRSTRRVATVCTCCSTALMCFGVNPFETIDRSRKCWGSSMAIIEPKNSVSSGGMSLMLTPPRLEQNRSGCRLTCHTSAWRVTAWKPGPGGNGDSSNTTSG